MDHILLTRQKLNVEHINQLVTQDSCGAISTFVGITRNNFNGRQVVSLEYECYEQMAVKELKTICTELRGSFGELENIAIYHRLGAVPVGEASVVIATASPHRRTAIDATSAAIDKLKARVPIWKKEIYADDEAAQSAWKTNSECFWLNGTNGAA